MRNAMRSARPFVVSSTGGATKMAVRKDAAWLPARLLIVIDAIVLKTSESVVATANPQINTGTMYRSDSRS
jgi:hypothetical protein